MAVLALIGMAMAIPATVAFSASPPPTPPPSDPPAAALSQPAAAVTPAPAAPATPQSRPPGPPPALLAALPPGLPAALPPALPDALPPALPPKAASAPGPHRDVGQIVVNAALTRLGAPYAWAAAGPDAFDCSGLVVWAFKQAGLTMPHSSTALASGGEPVALDQMQPGDVISLFPDASHVGIYAGNGRMIHAQFEGLPVIVESLRGAPINNVRRYR